MPGEREHEQAPQAAAISRHALRDLEAVWDELLEMAQATEFLLDTSLRAFRARDVELAGEARRLERAIDGREVHLERQCLRALTLYEPAATDLRRVAVALKVNTALERVADLAAHIAKRVKKLTAEPVPEALRVLSDEVRRAFAAAFDALKKGDANAARSVIRDDHPIDEHYHVALTTLKQALRREPERVDTLLRLINTARNLERIGDHATNIAEAVLYLTEGAIVRRGDSSLQ